MSNPGSPTTDPFDGTQPCSSGDGSESSSMPAEPAPAVSPDAGATAGPDNSAVGGDGNGDLSNAGGCSESSDDTKEDSDSDSGSGSEVDQTSQPPADASDSDAAGNEPTDATLWPLPTGVPTYDPYTEGFSSTGASISTTVTFYKATPPSSVVLVSPTVDSAEGGGSASAFSVTNTISVQPTSPVYVTIIAPDGEQDSRTTVLTISEQDPSWQSVIPQLIPSSPTAPTNVKCTRCNMEARRAKDMTEVEDERLDATAFVGLDDGPVTIVDPGLGDIVAGAGAGGSSVSLVVCYT